MYVFKSEREKAMVGDCIKLPSLGPGPLDMMDNSPQAKHLISPSEKINKLNNYKKRRKEKKRRWMKEEMMINQFHKTVGFKI